MANWSRSENGLELHEALTSPTGDEFATANRDEALNSRMYFGVNVANHRLRRFVPPAPCGVALPALVFRLAEWESLCESPHAAQGQDNGRPFRKRGKKSAQQLSRRNSIQVCSFVHRQAQQVRQTQDDPPVDSRETKRRTSRDRIRRAD